MNAKNQTKSSLQIVVNAKTLFEEHLTPENQEQIIDECVALMDPNGFGSPFGNSNKDQVTVIYKDDKMEWSIRAINDEGGSEAGYVVVLDSINQEVKPPSTGFFTKNPLEPNMINGDIVGTVVSGKRIPDGAEESYTILFHITKGTETTPILPIDPKLQIRKN